MRINAYFFERILIRTIPLLLFINLFILFINREKQTAIQSTIFIILVTLLGIFYIAIDIIKVKRNIKLSSAKIKSSQLLINNKIVPNETIFSICPIVIQHYRWSISIVEIISDKSRFYLLEKRQFFNFKYKNSKTIELIVQNIPELASKILPEVRILNQYPNK